MSMDEIRRGVGLIITGLMMIMIALIVELVLATTVGDYYSFSKAT